MGAHFPDTDTLRSALALANRAPSIYNTQPWQWRVDGDSIHLLANPDLLLPHTDPERRDLILSCGAVLNHCVVALAALGWQAKVQRLPNPGDINHLAVLRLSSCSVAQIDVTLAAAIPRRRTDRRHYNAWPVPSGDIALMGARAARAGVLMRRIDDLAQLRQLVIEAAHQHGTDRDYLAEMTRWSGRYASVAGVPARNVPGINGSSRLPVRVFAGGVLAQTDTAAADDNAVVLALGTADDDQLSWLRAGEATSIVLLTATALGLVSCPITEPLELPDTREAVRSDVFGAEGNPQMLLRVGWGPVNADPLPPTPRRALSEVVAYLNGSPLSGPE